MVYILREFCTVFLLLESFRVDAAGHVLYKLKIRQTSPDMPHYLKHPEYNGVLTFSRM